MADGDRALAIRVEGEVQGVGYRAFTRDEAGRRGVSGWVINRPDGSVEAALYGPGAALAELIGALRKGPPAGRVANLDVRSTDRAATAEPPPGAQSF